MRSRFERWRGKRSPLLSAGLAAGVFLLALGWWKWELWTPLFMGRENAFLLGAAHAGEDPERTDPWGGEVQRMFKRVGCCGEEVVYLSAGPNGRLESWVSEFRTWSMSGLTTELNSLGGDDLYRGEHSFPILTPSSFMFRHGSVFFAWAALLGGWWLLCTLLCAPDPERALGGLTYVGLLALGGLGITAGGDYEVGAYLVRQINRLGLEQRDLVHPSLYLVPFVGAAVVAALGVLASRRRAAREA